MVRWEKGDWIKWSIFFLFEKKAFIQKYWKIEQSQLLFFWDLFLRLRNSWNRRIVNFLSISPHIVNTKNNTRNIQNEMKSKNNFLLSWRISSDWYEMIDILVILQNNKRLFYQQIQNRKNCSFWFFVSEENDIRISADCQDSLGSHKVTTCFFTFSRRKTKTNKESQPFFSIIWGKNSLSSFLLFSCLFSSFFLLYFNIPSLSSPLKHLLASNQQIPKWPTFQHTLEIGKTRTKEHEYLEDKSIDQSIYFYRRAH